MGVHSDLLAYTDDDLPDYIARTVQEGLGITLDAAEIAAMQGYIENDQSTVSVLQR